MLKFKIRNCLTLLIVVLKVFMIESRESAIEYYEEKESSARMKLNGKVELNKWKNEELFDKDSEFRHLQNTKPNILSNLLSNLGKCSQFQDCFNCTSYIDDYVNCYWRSGMCTNIGMDT